MTKYNFRIDEIGTMRGDFIPITVSNMDDFEEVTQTDPESGQTVVVDTIYQTYHYDMNPTKIVSGKATMKTILEIKKELLDALVQKVSKKANRLVIEDDFLANKAPTFVGKIISREV